MELIGKITGINTSDGMCNIAVIDKEGNLTNLKLGLEEAKGLKNGSVYKFLYNVVQSQTAMVHRSKSSIMAYRHIAVFMVFDQCPVVLSDGSRFEASRRAGSGNGSAFRLAVCLSGGDPLLSDYRRHRLYPQNIFLIYQWSFTP